MAEAIGMLQEGENMAGLLPGGEKPLPDLNKFVAPAWKYSPQMVKDQQTTFNPMSTSQHYLARFGIAKHF
jgi:hypothetical protein